MRIRGYRCIRFTPSDRIWQTCLVFQLLSGNYQSTLLPNLGVRMVVCSLQVGGLIDARLSGMS
jgi:hypothetical protein